ncbi:DUF4192 family protein [Arthrobacter sp. RCC_34]|uniref:DUF4192 family protein n=1 Tax=Arthrobacter sp. RCC_34 TaxID=3239230 RepID=UPI0035235CD1
MNTASLTARGPEDILAYIPHAIGFWPQDSLVCLTARSGRIGATLRVDLPDRKQSGASLLAYVRAVLTYLEHDTSADSTFVAMFESGRVAAARHERAELMALLAWVLGQAGRPVHELWLVGTDGWNGSGCRESVCSLTGSGPCDDGGPHPLDLIRDSRLAAELVYQGSAVDPHPGTGSRPKASDGGPGAHEAREARESRGSAGREEPHASVDIEHHPATSLTLPEVLERWEPFLDGSASWTEGARGRTASTEPIGPEPAGPEPAGPEPAGTGPATAEALCRTLEDPSLRDAVYVSAGSSWRTAYEGGRAAEAVLAGAVGPAAHAGPGHGLADGLNSPEGYDSPEGRVGDNWLGIFGEVFVGESVSGPDWDRMNRFAAVLQDILHRAGDRPPAGVLTGLAWVEWCRGRGSQASALLERALVVEPDHRLASLLHRMILSGALSGWASKRHSSWRRPLDRTGDGPDMTPTPGGGV